MIAPEVLEGEKVRLRPGREDDLEHFVRWVTDPDVRHWQHGSDRPDTTLEAERERFQDERTDPARIFWTIETLDGKPIGYVGLFAIEPYHGRAELGIAIGEKECWSQGYGTDAIRCLLRHAFEGMGLRRVGLITDVDNARGIRCYEKCGFVREGLLRAHRLRYGRPLDMVVMGALRDEWANGDGRGEGGARGEMSNA